MTKIKVEIDHTTLLRYAGKMLKNGWRVEFTGGNDGWYTWTSPKRKKYQGASRNLPPERAIEEYLKSKS